MGFLPLKSLVNDAQLQETIEQIKNAQVRTEFHKKQLAQVIEQLKCPTSANVQFMLIPGRMNFQAGIGNQSKLFGKVLPEDHDNISIAVALQYPASRGSVHITSSDPLKQPQIDPGCKCWFNIVSRTSCKLIYLYRSEPSSRRQSPCSRRRVRHEAERLAD
jgi:hypothetical protein